MKEMRKQIVALFAVLTATGAGAQVTDGYYRIQNAYSQRYLALLDNKGWVEGNSGGVDHDLYAIRSLQDNETNKIVSNPATVIYIKSKDGGYVCHAQGTNTQEFTSHVFNMTASSSKTYRISAESANIARVVLNDIDSYSGYYAQADSGLVSTSGTNRRDWILTPVSSEGSNYVGFSPDLEYNGKYYQTFYAEFPFRVVSSGVKVYYITYFNNHAVLHPFADGEVVPGATAVLVECSSADASDNRIEPVVSTLTAPSANKLHGVYFRYVYGRGRKTHNNRTAYDPATMRLLRAGADGKPEFVKVESADTMYIEPNTAYLEVSKSAADELPLMTMDEYTLGIGEVEKAKTEGSDVYTLSGVKVGNTSNLPHGVYIIDGKKVVK